MKKDMSKKAKNERRTEKLIHKALSDLQVLTRIYIGEREIARGDTIPHEVVWKRFKEKYAFKLKDKEKRDIKKEIEEKIYRSAIDQAKQITAYVIHLLENRDTIYKRSLPKSFPSPLPNHHL